YNDQRNEWTYVAPMGARRSGLSVSTLDHCIYAVGGSDEGIVLNTVERLDPREGKWEFVSSMSTPRKYLGTAETRDYLYAVGGQDGSNCPLNSAERYDPRLNKWTAVASMENMRSG
ncbi:kelch repeat protein, partial [Teladorsagia circumcincta]